MFGEMGDGLNIFLCSTFFPFLGGLRHGHGIMRWPDDRSYDGEWEKSNMQGVGVYKWPSGAVYEGQWKDDIQHGQGTKREANGSS